MRSVARLAIALAVAAIAVVAGPSPVAITSAQESGARTRVWSTRHGGPVLDVVARVRTGVQPKSVTISPDGTRLVVCNFGQLDRDNVYVLDATTLERVGIIEFAGNAVEAAFSHDGATLYVSNFRGHSVEVIDWATLTVSAVIPVGHHPKFMVVSPDDRTLYVANYFEGSVSVVDVSSAREVRRLRTGRHPRGMVVRPDGTLLAAAFHGDVVHVFPEDATRESARWEMCELPRHLLMSPDAATMYATCSMGHVGVYDAESGRRLGIGRTGRNPRSIAINGDGRWIGVANFSSHDVSLIDTVGRRHRTYDVPGAHGIVGVAMHPGPRARLYATSWDTNELIMLAEREPIAAAPATAPSALTQERGAAPPGEPAASTVSAEPVTARAPP